MENLLVKYQSFVYFGLIVISTIALAFIVKRYIQNKLLSIAKEHGIDAASFMFINHLIISIIYLLGFGWALLTLPITHTFAHTLLAGAGASTLILGFASQELFTNLLSGFYLVIAHPFKLNDTIEFQGIKGEIISINMTSIKIIDTDGNETIIPSSLILNDKIKIIKTQ